MSETDKGILPILAWMALFVTLGAPFVYLIWEFVNQILSGRFDPATAGLALVGVVGAAERERRHPDPAARVHLHRDLRDVDHLMR